MYRRKAFLHWLRVLVLGQLKSPSPTLSNVSFPVFKSSALPWPPTDSLLLRLVAAKTRAQLKRRNHDVAAIKPGIRGWYAGYGATLVGTTVKASVRM